MLTQPFTSPPDAATFTKVEPQNPQPTTQPPPWPNTGPRCPHRPPTLTTPRLTLRPVTHDDLPLYRATFGCPKVMATVLKRTETEREIRERVNRYASSWHQQGTLHVFAVCPRVPLKHPVSGRTLPIHQPVGDAMLVPVQRQGPEIELGYRLASHAWGMGIATEAAAALIPYAFRTLRLTHLIAVTDPSNTPSQNVLSKLGFTKQGTTDRFYNQTTLLFTLDEHNQRHHLQPRHDNPPV